MEIALGQISGYVMNALIGLIATGILALIRMLKKQNDFIPKIENHITRQLEINQDTEKNIDRIKDDTTTLCTRIVILETEHNHNHKK